MSLILISATEESPLIDFNINTGECVIKGKSTMKSPCDFYSGIYDQLVSLKNEINGPVRLILDFDFFNIASSKEILKIIYVFNEWFEAGVDAKVRWYYNQFDDHMEDLGKDFAFMVKVPFEFESLAVDMAV